MEYKSKDIYKSNWINLIGSLIGFVLGQIVVVLIWKDFGWTLMEKIGRGIIGGILMSLYYIVFWVFYLIILVVMDFILVSYFRIKLGRAFIIECIIITIPVLGLIFFNLNTPAEWIYYPILLVAFYFTQAKRIRYLENKIG